MRQVFLFFVFSPIHNHKQLLYQRVCVCVFGRVYPVREVPVETEALTDWLYQRFVEKEELLGHFYQTGEGFHPLRLPLPINMPF